MTRIKPHLYRRGRMWFCVACRANAVGDTPREAFRRWRTFMDFHVKGRAGPAPIKGFLR